MRRQLGHVTLNFLLPADPLKNNPVLGSNDIEQKPTENFEQKKPYLIKGTIGFLV